MYLFTAIDWQYFMRLQIASFHIERFSYHFKTLAQIAMILFIEIKYSKLSLAHSHVWRAFIT